MEWLNKLPIETIAVISSTIISVAAIVITAIFNHASIRNKTKREVMKLKLEAFSEFLENAALMNSKISDPDSYKQQWNNDISAICYKTIVHIRPKYDEAFLELISCFDSQKEWFNLKLLNKDHKTKKEDIDSLIKLTSAANCTLKRNMYIIKYELFKMGCHPIMAGKTKKKIKEYSTL